MIDGFNGFTGRNICKCQLKVLRIKAVLKAFIALRYLSVWMIKGKDFGAGLKQRIDPDRS